MNLLKMAEFMKQSNDYLDAEIDIIAIHGLRDSPVQSWINKSFEIMWLRDLLQVDISTSRVMSYEYETENVFRRDLFDLDKLIVNLVNSIINVRTKIRDTAVRIAQS